MRKILRNKSLDDCVHKVSDNKNSIPNASQKLLPFVNKAFRTKEHPAYGTT